MLARAVQAAVLLCAACCAGAQWASSATTQPNQIIDPNPITCECSDANPRDGVYYNVTYTCLQQLVFGNCGQHFITDSVKELSEGYCQITCGRCNCCSSVADVLQSNDLTELLQVARLAGLDKQLASPASMFTLLAPTNDAFTSALSALGSADLESIPATQLQALLGYHIIPPHPGIDAVWTNPFFSASNGANIPTALPNAPLSFSSSGSSVMVKGDSNSASIVKSDVEACKSFINIIDAVLIPPKGTEAASLPTSAGNIAAAFGPAPSLDVQAAAIQGFSPSASLQVEG